MLVLSRRPGESVVIRDEHGKDVLTVTVVSFRGNQVKLGFVGDHKVIREELLNQTPKE